MHWNVPRLQARNSKVSTDPAHASVLHGLYISMLGRPRAHSSHLGEDSQHVTLRELVIKASDEDICAVLELGVPGCGVTDSELNLSLGSLSEGMFN